MCGWRHPEKMVCAVSAFFWIEAGPQSCWQQGDSHRTFLIKWRQLLTFCRMKI